MNLAKIRQKSRNNKLLGISEKVKPNISKDVPEPAYSPEPSYLEDEHRLDKTFTIVSQPGIEENYNSLPEPKIIKRDFDPVEVILAGRVAAGCYAEQQLEPEEMLSVDAGEYAEFLCFRISDELYGIDIMQIKEIIKPKAVTEVPRAPGFLTGVISLRGVIIPVIDMLSRLGFSSEADTYNQRIIVVRSGSGFSGLLVDEVIQVIRISKNSIEAAPIIMERIDKDYISGIGRSDSRMIILLNLDSVTDINLF